MPEGSHASFNKRTDAIVHDHKEPGTIQDGLVEFCGGVVLTGAFGMEGVVVCAIEHRFSFGDDPADCGDAGDQDKEGDAQGLLHMVKLIIY